MARRQYDPRRRERKALAAGRRLPPDQRSWLHLSMLKVVQYRGPDRTSRPKSQAEADDEKLLAKHGERHGILFLEVHGDHEIFFELSLMTEEELDKFQEYMNFVIDEARDECRSRDEAAKEAYENGDDSFDRLYRQVPQIVTRKGESREDGPSL